MPLLPWQVTSGLEVAKCQSACFESECQPCTPQSDAPHAGAGPRLAVVDPKAGKSTAAAWRLSILELLRPEDELEDLLAAGDYSAAPALAKKHGLAQDVVLK